MWNRKLLKNKIYAVILILIGVLTVPIEWDITFFIFTLILGGGLFFAKENWIISSYEEEYEDELSEDYAD